MVAYARGYTSNLWKVGKRASSELEKVEKDGQRERDFDEFEDVRFCCLWSFSCFVRLSLPSLP